MKKLVLAAVVGLFAFTATAQNFSAGVTVGLPSGDFSDFYTLNLGLDVNALWEVSDEFNVGVATGYNHSILDSDFEGDAFSYIPAAAAARYSVSEEFTLGADLGYGIVLTDGVDSGFYYRPMVGYNVSDNTQITASYRGVSLDGASFSTINLGVNFGL